MKKWALFLALALAFLSGHATPPPAAEVFKVSVKTVDPNTFAITWQIEPGYFLYADRIKLDESPDSNVHIGTLRFPQALSKTDKQGRTYRVYRDKITLPIAILGKEAGESLLTLHYQGCADDGFCYPPETQAIKLTIDQHLALVSTNLESDITTEEPAPLKSDETQGLFDNAHWTMIILSFFSFGLLLSFTPCVLPMVPVLSGIIVGHSGAMTTRKAFLLSLSYVLSMAVTYAAVGAVVAVLGSNLQIAMQAPPIIVLFSLVFVLLALSMFGFFELKLPVSWQAALAKVSRNQSSGHYLGAAIMGCLSTLILSPCVTAPLIGALGYIAHTGNVTLGSLALFSLGLGMGTPLLVIGTSAGKWLPKAGNWMNAVKSFFGVMLLAVAIYLLSRIIPGAVSMSLWAALLVFCGVFIGAFLPAETKTAQFHKALGILLLVYGLLILIGASMGETNPLQPLARFQMTTASHAAAPVTLVKNINDVELAVNKARGKPVMIDFYADWCASCKIMENTTFKDPEVTRKLKQFIILKADVTANNQADQLLMKKFGVVAPPTFVFFNPHGRELTNLQLVGEQSPQRFLQQLQQITTGTH
ncbi:thiol:disulfide interchange protein DsbD [Legionella rubrilucens]|uniref:Thiol:disulfide interchange protein DsbD n=1 Tax=Legionella rubrilucens TaxID=458 RepID=A0A0W0XV88_9GAMM|nr:protein-disulfide reductase DsbD [Legionella rubrilucens]KTD48733.1 thiol:disulfide interchange protein DsbD [Legionella rubrilucens]